MCKKYLNTNLTCYESVVMDNGTPIAFRNPFDQKDSLKLGEGVYQVKGFQIVSNINILGTANKEAQKDHILYKKNGKLDFIIRLTKCDKDISNRIFYDLDTFSLIPENLRANNEVDEACFDFVNYARITSVPTFSVQKPGRYVLKLLVKESGEQKSTVQFIKKFIIN